MSYKCEKCGGTEVTIRCSYNPNTKEIIEDDYAYDNGYCEDCDEPVCIKEHEN